MDDLYLKKKWPLACAFLGRIRKLQRQIFKLEAQRYNQQLLLSDRSSHLTGMPHSDSPDLQKDQTRTVEIDELKERIDEAWERIKTLKTEIGEIISKIDDPISQRVLILHFVQNEPWINTARAIGYCPRSMRKFRDAALTEVEEMLKETDEDWKDPSL